MTIRGYLTTTGTHTVIRDAYQQGRQVTLQVDVGQNAAPVTGSNMTEMLGIALVRRGDETLLFSSTA